MGPLPWTIRPATRDDLAAIVDLANRTAAFDGIERAVEVDEMDEEFDGDRVRYDTDVRVVDGAGRDGAGGDSAGGDGAGGDGALAAYAYTYHLPSEVLAERTYVFGAVDGTRRGEGIGRALVQWGIERASEQLRTSTNALPKFVRVEAYDTLAGTHRLYARCGFTPVRWFDELLRPLDGAVPDVPSEFDGVRIVPWPTDRDEDIRSAKNEAFADHWGSTPTSVPSWHRLVRGFGAWPEASFVAVDDDGGIVGHCLNHRYRADAALTGRREGVIDSLGVRRGWRGRGLASAMIGHSLRAFAAADCTHASIFVDSDNPTGAARLYRALGFEPLRRSITHQIELA